VSFNLDLPVDANSWAIILPSIHIIRNEFNKQNQEEKSSSTFNFYYVQPHPAISVSWRRNDLCGIWM